MNDETTELRLALDAARVRIARLERLVREVTDVHHVNAYPMNTLGQRCFERALKLINAWRDEDREAAEA